MMSIKHGLSETLSHLPHEAMSQRVSGLSGCVLTVNKMPPTIHLEVAIPGGALLRKLKRKLNEIQLSDLLNWRGKRQ